jgi:hypothetical protein
MKFRHRLAGFASKTFPRLKRSKILTTFFDKLLLGALFVTDHRVYKNYCAFNKALKTWANVTNVRHQFGGEEYRYQGREICHIHGNGIIDIRWGTQAEKQMLIKSKICENHFIEPETTWTTFYLDKSNLDKAIQFAVIRYKSLTLNQTFIDPSGKIDPQFL